MFGQGLFEIQPSFSLLFAEKLRGITFFSLCQRNSSKQTLLQPLFGLVRQQHALSPMVVPKSYQLGVCPKSTIDEFPSLVIIRNCWLQQYSGLNPSSNICFTCEETLLSLNLGNFAEFIVIVLLIGKIPQMKISIVLYLQLVDLKRPRKYYLLQVQLAYLVNFAHFLLQLATHFTFSALQISLTLL